MIRIGVCAPMASAEAIKSAGFDYFECSVAGVLCPSESEAIFAERLQQLRALPLPCEALNILLPGGVSIIGEAVDKEGLRAYLETTLSRAQRAGIKLVVFGSGRARKIPEGFDPQRAEEQLYWFSTLVAELAAAAGVTIVVEPLNSDETNTLVTAAEGAEWVRRVNHPAFQLLVDGYHMMREDESPEVIKREVALIRHMHVATRANRCAPGLEPCPELDGFFAAVKESGYNGRMSIEGKLGDQFPASLPAIHATLCGYLR